jgi:hypothetical protein
MVKGAILTVLAITPASAAVLLLPYSVLPLGVLGLSVGLGIGLWVMGLALLGHPLWEQMRLLVGRPVAFR